MATVERALQTQIRNIEAQYGRSVGEWTGNAMFSHRVRVRSADDVDAELSTWIARAYDRAS